eukprot:COSAG05_NODE_2267_length_3306_cov_49.931400_3_plen_142_part_00
MTRLREVERDGGGGGGGTGTLVKQIGRRKRRVLSNKKLTGCVAYQLHYAFNDEKCAGVRKYGMARTILQTPHFPVQTGAPHRKPLRSLLPRTIFPIKRLLHSSGLRLCSRIQLRRSQLSCLQQTQRHESGHPSPKPPYSHL